MECIVAIEEMTRNLLMLAAWLPSLAVAVLVFLTVFSRRHRDGGDRGVRGTIRAIGFAAVTLFGTWITLLFLGSRLFC